MHNLYKKSFTVLLLCLNVVILFSQASTLSPYTRYGLGELNSVSFGRSNAMGDLYTTLRAPSQINIGNPASYTAQDTVSFIFDIGINTKFVNYQNDDDNINLAGSNIDHIAFGFPITRKLKMSTGIYPYSYIGYRVLNNTEFEDTTFTELNKNEGNGGINKLFIGAAYQIIPELSVGLNVNYLFGNIDYTNESSVYYSDPEDVFLSNTSTSTISYLYRRMDESNTRIDGVYLDLGLQYEQKINDNHKLHLGLVYSPKMNLRTKYNKQVYRESALYANGAYSGALASDTITSSGEGDPITLPSKLAVGIAYEYKDKLFIGVDYSRQDWSSFSYPTIQNNLTSSQQISVGAQFIPNPRAFNGYYNIMRYYLGAYYKENYIYLNNTQITDFGITAGVGLPMGGKTIFNVSYKYGNRGTTDMSLIQENYSQINIGFSFYDFWFIKSKYD